MAFGPEDGLLFQRLGRDHELAQLLSLTLNDQIPLIVVMGESGVGKTSLLRAGLPYTGTAEIRVKIGHGLMPYVRIRRTEVLPMPTRRAISDWLKPCANNVFTSCAFFTAEGGRPRIRPAARA
jgi:hypothetical protein